MFYMTVGTEIHYFYKMSMQVCVCAHACVWGCMCVNTATQILLTWRIWHPPLFSSIFSEGAQNHRELSNQSKCVCLHLNRIMMACLARHNKTVCDSLLSRKKARKFEIGFKSSLKSARSALELTSNIKMQVGILFSKQQKLQCQIDKSLVDIC